MDQEVAVLRRKLGRVARGRGTRYPRNLVYVSLGPPPSFRVLLDPLNELDQREQVGDEELQLAFRQSRDRSLGSKARPLCRQRRPMPMRRPIDDPILAPPHLTTEYFELLSPQRMKRMRPTPVKLTPPRRPSPAV